MPQHFQSPLGHLKIQAVILEAPEKWSIKEVKRNDLALK